MALTLCPFCRDRARTSSCKVCSGTGRLQHASALFYRDVLDSIDDMTPEERQDERAWIDAHCTPIPEPCCAPGGAGAYHYKDGGYRCITCNRLEQVDE
jgi:hypothetical protein